MLNETTGAFGTLWYLCIHLVACEKQCNTLNTQKLHRIHTKLPVRKRNSCFALFLATR